MPQAMPLNWLSLYFTFIIIFFIIIVKIYYSQNKNPKAMLIKFMKKNNWKW
uniref:ATP synthase F0 subunit 8 n=1 Tax=Calvia championorum TaxID=1856879 RepID=A0A191UJ40_9CUCU|nr:ATP synthase F0 subunit 8 [Calvia championorum]